MFNNTPFYHATIQRITVAFANMFNDIKIVRENGDIIKVPISFGNKEAWWVKSKINIDDGKTDIATLLPRIGYTFSNVAPDRSRQTSRKLKLTRTKEISGTKIRNVQWNRTPYRCTFTLFVVAKTKTDSLQIIEQILPYFSPAISVTIRDQKDHENSQDIKFTLVGTDHQDTSEGDLISNRRIIEWQINFDCEFYLYGPITDAKLIKKVIIDTKSFSEGLLETYQVTPDPSTAIPPDPFEYDELIIEYA